MGMAPLGALPISRQFLLYMPRGLLDGRLELGDRAGALVDLGGLGPLGVAAPPRSQVENRL
jgi:hypothetical protein